MINAADPDLVWVLTPFERPDAKPVIAAARAGALGVLDLGVDRRAALDALVQVNARIDGPFGVRVPSWHCPIQPAELPERVSTVILGSNLDPARWRRPGRRVIAEVCSVDEARDALAVGVDGLVAKGSESGGRVGHTGAFVLLQEALSVASIPVWVQGGIGRHSAAAALVGGAAGVVVDSQIALLRESTVPAEVRAVVAAMDGSETRVIVGHRVYSRPDLWVAGLDETTRADELSALLGGDSLTAQALPVGQDGALAAPFERRYGTVGMMVAGLRRAVLEHVATARTGEPLAPRSGVASVVGTQYPVAQGPMTRVSDQPRFAAAVADGGGLPFLALALLPGAQVRALLSATAELLGDLPWGVGILGFVPKDLRDEQLAVVRDIRPPLALIAGGRPSLAAPLEELGIKTYLHVPSPGLLARFLKEGARRFVFEGSECGGHVGPRTSFALWEAQIEVLLERGRLDGVSVLFAGGIHDERSAAMVATMAAPLVAAGADIGVLMGTAYLFTEEAVSTGAITEQFQREAVDCGRTALLESGPGHATRCAETPFVRTFEHTRRQLRDQGAEPAVIWAELENLNLGRLRLAAKGLKREGDRIVAADAEEQRDDGMFMIGEVATLHREITTVSALHETVTTGAVQYLQEVVVGLERDPEGEAELGAVPEPVDIAIVGVSCVMPGAADVEEFWRNIVRGVDSVTEVPPERFPVDRYWNPDYDHATAHGDVSRSASKWGGFLPAVEFDALAYGIPPASLGSIEPVQLLALKSASDALADAGYANREFDRDHTSVIFGVEGGTDMTTFAALRAVLPLFLRQDVPAELAAFLPRLTEDSFPGLLANIVAGRIANRLDLGGKNYTVSAACASSLAALDAACQELASGQSNIVLCGAADVHNGIHDYLLFTSVHALSPTGQCRTFDASADGIVLGEGAACLVLKRLVDAERDGDRIYAVIKGVAGSSDGRSLGLTAPRQQGQERAVRRAYQRAGVSPSAVELVEAHGTGTVVGDRTELGTLTACFTEAGAAPQSVVLGSVKSNIGHTKCAAGLAGLIKAAKAVYHGVLPPTLHVSTPNREWDPDKSPFVFLEEARPWLSDRRTACVSAFGFGGTNFHAIVESYDEEPVPAHGLAHWPAELFLFRAPSDDDLDAVLDSVLARLDEGSSPDRWRLRDVAAAVWSQGRGPIRLAVVATDVDDLRAKLIVARGRAEAGTGSGAERTTGVYLTDPAVLASGRPPAVALLFPGQGSQRPGMTADLFTAFPRLRQLLRRGAAFAPRMLPPAAFTSEARQEQQEALTDTRVAQPALGIADLAVADVLLRAGVRPSMLAGHSYGELVALCVAGSFDVDTLLGLSVARADAILEAAGDDPGAMVAVAASRAEVEAAVSGLPVAVANDNHPRQIVLAGPTAAIDEAVARLSAAQLRAKRLPVACAFHSPVVAGAADRLRAKLGELAVGAPAVPVWSNLTAAPYPPDASEVRRLLAAQVANGVRFTEQVGAMHDQGARVFVEVGPGRVLTGLVGRILGDRPHVAVACDGTGGDGVTAVLHALGQLAGAGLPIDPTVLFTGRDVEPGRWTRPARKAGWTVDGHLVRGPDGRTVPGGLRPATEAPHLSMRAGSGGWLPGTGGAPDVPALVAGADEADLETALGEYFRVADELIESGRQLIHEYLGTDPSNRPPVPVRGELLTPAAAGWAGREEGAEVVVPVRPADAPAVLSREELLGRLLAVVSARTGYPAEMLDPDLDVEADLSIDSIKRIEILGELADEVGLGAGAGLDHLEDLVEELAQRKTLRAIVDWLWDRLQVSAAGAAVDAGVTGAPGLAAASAAPVVVSREELLGRLVAVVSARTGYPAEMLDPDLDVEADLSIDSIKRIEILGELADEVGLGAGAGLDHLEDLVEELAERKTLRAIVDWVWDRLTSSPAAPRWAAELSAAAASLAPTERAEPRPGSSRPVDDGVIATERTEAGPTGPGLAPLPTRPAPLEPRPGTRPPVPRPSLPTEPGAPGLDEPSARPGLPTRPAPLDRSSGTPVEASSAPVIEPPSAMRPVVEPPSAVRPVVEPPVVEPPVVEPPVVEPPVVEPPVVEPPPVADRALPSRPVVPPAANGAGAHVGPAPGTLGGPSPLPLRRDNGSVAPQPPAPSSAPGADEATTGLSTDPLPTQRLTNAEPPPPAARPAEVAPSQPTSATEGLPPRRLSQRPSAGATPADSLSATSPTPSTPAPAPAPAPEARRRAAVSRWTLGLSVLAAPTPDIVALAGGTIAVCGTNAVARGVADALAARGLDARLATPGKLPTGTVLVVLAQLLDEPAPPLPELYGLLRGLLVEGNARVAVLSGLGGGLGIDPVPSVGDDVVPPSAGMRGLVKTAAIEFPHRSVRLVDVDPAEPIRRLAGHLVDELADTTGPTEVAWRAGARRTAHLVAEPWPSPATADVALTPESVVLVTGGARGITARIALALARSSRCTVELVGRSPLPAAVEDPDLAGAADRVALREALLARGLRDPRTIEQECDRLESAREVRTTLEALAGTGAPVVYHAVDVRDPEALGRVVDDLYERHGRLDGVIHGAGVVDDHLIVDKSPEAFERVWATKVDGARTLLSGLRRPPRFIVLFGSIAGVLGNRGQADYAAANDALDSIARANAGRAQRLVSIDWGPWEAGTGMVSESLAAVLEAGGAELISEDDGVASLLRELAVLDGPAQVVVVRGTPALSGGGERAGGAGPLAGPGPSASPGPGTGPTNGTGGTG